MIKMSERTEFIIDVVWTLASIGINKIVETRKTNYHIIETAYYDGWSVQEIGDLINRSDRYVKKAIRKLKLKELENNG